MKQIAVIVGPTASGKTALAVELAKRVGGEVVSADSMQIYQGMDIGTAKPTKEEMCGIPHYMIDIIPPDRKYSVGDYVKDAEKCIDGILSRGHLPILAGGTGLYIDTLLSGTRLSSVGEDENLRKELNAKAEELGGAVLKQELRKVDPETAERLADNDIRRIVRALEVYHSTGKTLTEWNRESKQIPSEYKPIYFGLTAQREVLYQRTDSRVDVMFERGLMKEVETLLSCGLNRTCTAMQAIGYKETAKAVLGECSLEDAKQAIKLGTRHYVKRQLTWFGRNKQINWFEIDRCEKEKIIDKVVNSTKCAFSF